MRRVWPEVEIVLRADSGFCRDELMSWCEQHGVDYVFGLAKNSRLLKRIRRQMQKAQRRPRTGLTVRNDPVPRAHLVQGVRGHEPLGEAEIDAHQRLTFDSG